MTMELPISQPRKSPRRKQNNFERLNIDVERSFEMIPIDRLRIPNNENEYQRDESEGRIAKEIAMHYDDIAFGALTVIERADGSLVVADGGTRLSAVRIRGDIEEVPCLVFRTISDRQEADTFLRINLNRRKLRTEQQQKPEVYAGHQLAIVAKKILDTFRNERIHFESLLILRRSIKKHAEATDTVFNILRICAPDKHVSARVFKGLIYLETLMNGENETMNRRSIIKRLQQNFGLLDAAINATLPPRSSGDQTRCAMAIAKTIKVRLPKTE